jgi:hypothetical protein
MSIAAYVDGRIEAFLHGMEVTNNRFLCRSLVLITICEELDCIDPALFFFFFLFFVFLANAERDVGRRI